MPKRNRKGRKQTKHAHKKHKTNQASNQQNLIDILHQTIIVYNAGDKNVNGVYQHKCLEEDYFERIGSIKSYKHSNLMQQKTNDTSNNIEPKQETKQPQNTDDKHTETPSKSVGKFEIDRHEYLKNADDIPDAAINKSGAWIISRVDVHPKQLLYAVNCPFKQKIKTNGWIVLKDGSNPAPKIKLFETKQVGNDEDNDVDMDRKQKKKKAADNIHDAIKEIRNDHRNANKLNKMQLKALQSATNKKNKKNGNKLMIVSGGQSGVDRAALDVAKTLNIAYSGWIPKGRKSEDGVIDEVKYGNLKECDSEEYAVRTLLNVVDSDATLILNMGKLEGGTLCTKKYVSQKNKDLMYITLFPKEDKDDTNEEEKKINNNEDDRDEYVLNLGFSDGRAQRVSEWIRCKNIKVLNVGGPRESERKGIYNESVEFLTKVLKNFKNGNIPRKCLFG